MALLALALIAPGSAVAEAPVVEPVIPDGSIAGVVTDSHSASPLGGATVIAYSYNAKKGLWSQKAKALSAADGSYDLVVAPGAYRLLFSRPGYVTECFDNVTGGLEAGTDVIVSSNAVTAASAALSTPFFIDGLSVSINGIANVQLSWNPIGGVGPYTVERAYAADFSDAVVLGSALVPFFTDEAPYNRYVNYRVTDVTGQPVSAQTLVRAGSGSVDDPFLVRSLDDLANITSISYWSHYLQIADIDASPTSDPGSRYYNNGAGWTSIGPWRFAGSYDGAGRSITGLYANNSYGAGLFGQMYGSPVIRNVNLIGCDIRGGQNVGGIAQRGVGLIENCVVDGHVAGVYSTGGICGTVSSGTTVTISGCIFRGSVDGERITGGILGNAASSVVVKDCVVDANVTATDLYCGGVVGWTNLAYGYPDTYRYRGTIDGCVVGGRIEGGCGTGGVVGWMTGTDISRTSVEADVYCSNSQVGGLVGDAYYSNTIRDCAVSGSVASVYSSDVGGLVGALFDGSLIADSCFYGTLPGARWSGGITSYMGSACSIESCYFDAELAPAGVNGFGSPRTTAEMQDPATFAGWDFASTWNAPSAGVYPTLQ